MALLVRSNGILLGHVRHSNDDRDSKAGEMRHIFYNHKNIEQLSKSELLLAIHSAIDEIEKLQIVAGRGAQCHYCGSLQLASYLSCSKCGAPRKWVLK